MQYLNIDYHHIFINEKYNSDKQFVYLKPLFSTHSLYVSAVELFREQVVIPVGWTFSPKKATSLLWWRESIAPLKTLFDNGLTVDGQLYTFELKFFVADGPAKSYICQFRGVTAKDHSCTYCRVCSIDGSKAHKQVFLGTTGRENHRAREGKTTFCFFVSKKLH